VTDTTTVLYALSTLAQTCAALAAFVGAVGIYKLQLQRDEHRRTEQTIRVLLFPVLGNVAPLPFDDVLTIARTNVAERSPLLQADARVRLPRALADWDDFTGRHRRVTRALFMFEGWNLLVILVSLVGFNYVLALASCPTTFWALWAAAVGTVAVTAYCVVAWTRG